MASGDFYELYDAFLGWAVIPGWQWIILRMRGRNRQQQTGGDRETVSGTLLLHQFLQTEFPSSCDDSCFFSMGWPLSLRTGFSPPLSRQLCLLTFIATIKT
jgi:hypothetical protein